MPELPEVQTIADQLNAQLPLPISSITTSKHIKKLFHTPLKGLEFETFLSVGRYGKWMIFQCESEKLLLSSLGMSGSWIIGKDEKIFPHTHLTIKGKNQELLRYVDPRRFGHFYYFTKTEWAKKKKSLGVDPLSQEFDFDYFRRCIDKQKNRPIKVALLDQKYFPGIGNYLASEICAQAFLHPERLCKELNSEEIKNLYLAIPIILKRAIQNGGVTFGGGYQNANGEKGNGKSGLIVFHQLICQNCKETEVTKITLAGRGTFFCNHCQH
ncbi:MAG: DNA-formamidopyrimidine glycosylase family protein [Bacteriovoracaceae bacterium]|nr:DNA-formamidopyrimidine glycosylase family protein [Bacteriovoracaceae bacterium]